MTEAVSEHYVHKEKGAEFGADFREDMPLSPLKKKMSTFNSGTIFNCFQLEGIAFVWEGRNKRTMGNLKFSYVFKENSFVPEGITRDRK